MKNTNYIKILIKRVLFICLLLAVCLNISCSEQYVEEETTTRDDIVNLLKNSENGIYESREAETLKERLIPEELYRDTNTEATLSFVGDTIIQKSFLNSIYNQENNYYDFNSAFQYIRNDLIQTDFTALCLESIFYNNNPNSDKVFLPDQFADTLKYLDIDLVALANNHALDGGINGVIKTIGVLDSMNINHIGTNKSIEDYNEHQGTTIANINSIRVGFINMTRYTSGIELPKDNPYAVNVYTTDYLANFQYNNDYEKIANQINYLKNKKVDIIMAIVHWGRTNSYDPSDQQLELANFLVASGVKVIIGSHPHVMQTAVHATFSNADKKDDFFVVYSLGNFFSISSNKNNNVSAILNIKIKRQDGTTYIDDISYKPITTISRDRNQFPRYIVFNTVETLNNLQTFENQELLQYMTKSIVDQLILSYKKVTSTWPIENDYYTKNNLIQFDNKTFVYTRLKDIYNANAYRR